MEMGATAATIDLMYPARESKVYDDLIDMFLDSVEEDGMAFKVRPTPLSEHNLRHSCAEVNQQMSALGISPAQLSKETKERYYQVVSTVAGLLDLRHSTRYAQNLE